MSARGSGRAGMDDKLKHHMSKKIAQLTRVIYHLNTRNDDHSAELAALKVGAPSTVTVATTSGTHLHPPPAGTP